MSAVSASEAETYLGTSMNRELTVQKGENGKGVGDGSSHPCP